MNRVPSHQPVLDNELGHCHGQARYYHDLRNTIGLVIVREWRRLLCEPSRVVGIVVQPLLFLVVFGVGFHNTFHLPNSELSYGAFFFPGVLGLVVLFSSIYATLTLVEDKKCGFFRLILSGPGGVFGAICGKILATASLGLVQSIMFLALVVFLPVSVSVVAIGIMLAFLAVGSLCFATIGVLFAWVCETPAAFHALMSVILIPMWLLSSAMFPVSEGVLYGLSLVNPMAYLVAGLRQVLVGDFSRVAFELFIIAAMTLACFGLLLRMLKKRPLE